MADKVLTLIDSLIDAVKFSSQCKKTAYYKVDGTIIGNGSQDFTKSYKSYNFNIDGVTTQLIDIPGIEGKEANFIEIINEALKKAHLVCYVAREAKGIEANTLEKIQSYLGKNVEVLGVHNVPLSPQKMYDGDDYVKDMQKKVKNELKKNCNIDEALRQKIPDDLYMGTVGCAVLPALCAITVHDGNSTFANPEDFEGDVKESLVTLLRQQKNFFLHATDKELLQISNIVDLKKAIINSCFNAPNRMRKNAFCRLQNVLNEGYLASIQEQHKAWKSYRTKAEKNADALISRLDDAKKSFQRNLSNAVKNAVKDFYTKEILENIIYPSIDYNAKIDTDDINDRFEKVKKSLDENFKNKIKKSVSDSSGDYFERVKEYAKDYVHSMTLQLENLKAEIPSLESSSFDWGGLGNFAFGMASMAASGAYIGSFFCPGIGTAIGAACGAVLGAIINVIKYGFTKETRKMNFKKIAQDKAEEKVKEIWKNLKPLIDNHIQSATKTGDEFSTKAMKVKEDAQITENLLSDFAKEMKKILKDISKQIEKLEASNVA